jgi:hypothetical protein
VTPIDLTWADGVDSIEDDATQSNRLVFGAGITAESLRLDVAPGDSLVVRVGNSEDAVQIVGLWAQFTLRVSHH